MGVGTGLYHFGGLIAGTNMLKAYNQVILRELISMWLIKKQPVVKLKKGRVRPLPKKLLKVGEFQFEDIPL